MLVATPPMLAGVSRLAKELARPISMVWARFSRSGTAPCSWMAAAA